MFQVYSKVIQLYIYIYSYIYSVTHVSILFQIRCNYRLLQDIKCSSLCYAVGPRCLSVLYIVVCVCSSQAPDLSLPLLISPLVTISLFSIPVSLFLFCK